MLIVDTDRMRIVLIESEPGAGTEELAQLVAAGHDVARCQEPGATGFACRGLANPSRCPLEGAGVDLAVAVRTASAFEVGGDERGVTCALRSHVPVIMVSPGGHPYGSAVIDCGDDLVASCAAVAASPTWGHAHAILASLRSMSGLPPGAAADIGVDAVRRRDGVDITVVVPTSIDRSFEAQIANRAVTAARGYDRYSPKVDVAVEWIDT